MTRPRGVRLAAWRARPDARPVEGCRPLRPLERSFADEAAEAREASDVVGVAARAIALRARAPSTTTLSATCGVDRRLRRRQSRGDASWRRARRTTTRRSEGARRPLDRDHRDVCSRVARRRSQLRGGRRRGGRGREGGEGATSARARGGERRLTRRRAARTVQRHARGRRGRSRGRGTARRILGRGGARRASCVERGAEDFVAFAWVWAASAATESDRRRPSRGRGRRAAGGARGRSTGVKRTAVLRGARAAREGEGPAFPRIIARRTREAARGGFAENTRRARGEGASVAREGLPGVAKSFLRASKVEV